MTRRFDPFADIERAFNAALRQAPATAAIPLDLYRDGETYIAKIDLPGVDAKSIDIDVDDRTLTIRAERRTATGENIQWLAHERPTGTFARQLTLGTGLAVDQISAEYTDGVLTLSIPVAEEAKPRKIQVAAPHTSTEIGAEAS